MSRDVNVSPGDYAPGGLSFTDHCERRIYMDLIERGWKEENTNKKKKKKTEPKSFYSVRPGNKPQGLFEGSLCCFHLHLNSLGYGGSTSYY